MTRSLRRTLYRYYVCSKAQKRGWTECPAPSLPAAEIEDFVVGQIQKLSQDSCAVRDTLRQARLQATQQVERLKLEKLSLELMVHQAIGYVAGFDAWLAAYRHRHLVRILNHLFSAVAS